jgi:hypothetical protein
LIAIFVMGCTSFVGVCGLVQVYKYFCFVVFRLF